MTNLPIYAQLINVFASILLLLSFAMLAQRRVLSLIDLFALQGLTLAVSTAVVAYGTGQTHLYWSAGITLVLKVGVLPWLLYRLIRQLDVRWEFEGLINIPTTMLILGVFFFQIREQFDSLDLKHLEKLKENE